jgi:hypothetical protein
VATELVTKYSLACGILLPHDPDKTMGVVLCVQVGFASYSGSLTGVGFFHCEHRRPSVALSLAEDVVGGSSCHQRTQLLFANLLEKTNSDAKKSVQFPGSAASVTSC